MASGVNVVSRTPMSGEMPFAVLRRRLARALVAMFLVAMPLVAVTTSLGAGDGVLGQVVLPGLLMLVLLTAVALCALRAIADPEHRATWLPFALGIGAWLTGEVVRAVLYPVDRPFPSVPDALYFLIYPFVAAGLLAMLHRRVGTFRRSLVLDGATAGVAVAAVALTVVVPMLSGYRDGEALGQLAYPLADAGLLALVVAALAMTARRPARDLAFVAAGLTLFAVCDATYVLIDDDTVVWLGAGWGVSMVLLALASNAPADDRPHDARPGPAMFLVPLVSAAAGIGLLLAGYVVDVPGVAAVLAALALVLGIVRTGVTFRENLALLETRRQAVTDDLTGLANRRRLGARLGELFAAGEPVGLLLIDLNRFKELNDTLGHPVGDRLLGALGPRLRAAVPEADLVARLGGDEFAVLLTGGPGYGTLADAAGRLQRAMDAPFALDGLALHIGGSVGGALAPGDAADPAALLQHADVAMYEAKRTGVGYAPYRADRDRHTRDRLELSEDLRRGIADGELVVHYQPKADLRTGRVVGVEALVRWEHPVRGMVFPDTFIPLAEETGLMAGLTRHVLTAAVHQAAAWRAEGHDLSVAVNLAMANLLDPQLPADVADLLRATGVAPDRLILEITENVVMGDPERVLGVLTALRALGVELALDDFGTGYSSLGYLKRLPVQEVKIDRSFVMGMGADEGDAAIVRATTELGRSFGLRVVAEGVEDADAWRALAAAGCTLAQGYHLSRPLPADQLAPLLSAGRVLAAA
jgi:diguanylate cyclase (GGDEF)-like protein